MNGKPASSIEIFQKTTGRCEMKGVNQKNVVVIGGGTGLAAVLRGLKKKNFNLTTIVTVADDGGSSGKLRDELDMLPPGDIRNVLVALADTEPTLERLLQHRFSKGEGLAGHNVGNLLIAAMQEITGDFVLAIKELSKVLAVKGEVLPATLQKVVLSAEFEDGTVITGESKIPNIGKKIKRVFIEPNDVLPLDEAIDAVNSADAILLGPGSLYTSIIPNLLVQELKKAIMDSKAKKIYICNLMTQPGETDNYSAMDHVKAIEEHVGEKFIEYIILNNNNIPNDIVEKYRLMGAVQVKNDEEQIRNNGYNVIIDDLIYYNNYLRHDAEKIADIVLSII